MGNYRLELLIPGLPSSGNAKLDDHFMVQNIENKKWHELVYLHSRKAGLPLKPLNRAKLTLVRHGSLYLDHDNLYLSFKSIVDGLVLAGVIADDSWAVTHKWDVDQVKSKRKDVHVHITVEELHYDGPDIKPRRSKKKTSKKTFKSSWTSRRRR